MGFFTAQLLSSFDLIGGGIDLGLDTERWELQV
jgi:hypothetical protein